LEIIRGSLSAREHIQERRRAPVTAEVLTIRQETFVTTRLQFYDSQIAYFSTAYSIRGCGFPPPI
jgi:hypothetical protein